MSEKPVLYYWNGRGRAEIIRLTLVAANVEWDEVHMKEASEIAKLRSEDQLLYNQVPLLKMDGLNLVQTFAIVRYLANKYGLDAKTFEQKYKLDLFCEGLRDFYQSFYSHKFIPDSDYMSGIAKSMDKYLPIFEKVLSDNNSTPFLTGDNLTFADLQLLEVCLAISDLKPGSMEKFPKIQAFFSKISILPNIANYLNSTKRFGVNNDEYVSNVKRTLQS